MLLCALVSDILLYVNHEKGKDHADIEVFCALLVVTTTLVNIFTIIYGLNVIKNRVTCIGHFMDCLLSLSCFLLQFFHGLFWACFLGFFAIIIFMTYHMVTKSDHVGDIEKDHPYLFTIYIDQMVTVGVIGLLTIWRFIKYPCKSSGCCQADQYHDMGRADEV